jgi:hypothetical protein
MGLGNAQGFAFAVKPDLSRAFFCAFKKKAHG